MRVTGAAPVRSPVAIVAGILITGRRGSSPDAGIWEMIQASSGSTAVLVFDLSRMLPGAVLARR